MLRHHRFRLTSFGVINCFDSCKVETLGSLFGAFNILSSYHMPKNHPEVTDLIEASLLFGCALAHRYPDLEFSMFSNEIFSILC